MRALVKHNGTQLPEVLCHINTASNIVTMQTMLEPGMNLDLDKVYVEVNLFGDLKPLEDDNVMMLGSKALEIEP